MCSTQWIRQACGPYGRRLFSPDLRPRAAIVVGILGVSLALGAAVFIASAADHSLRLPAPGRGLLDHLGFQACFVSAPLVLLTAYFAVGYFLRLLAGLGGLLTPQADRRAVARVVKPHLRSLFLRSRWRSALAFFAFVGVAVSLAIFRQLDNPVAFWGNDVFNAAEYGYGTIVANLILLLTWGGIYPVALFYAIHLTCSMELIVSHLKKEGLLRLDFLHIDRCAGMARFGTLNLIIMTIYLWPLGALYALHVTHRSTYASLVISAIGISIVFGLQSVYGIYWISRAVRKERASVVESLNQRIKRAIETEQQFTTALTMLEYRDRVLAVASFPYSSKVNIAVNVLRFTPALAAVARLWLRQP